MATKTQDIQALEIDYSVPIRGANTFAGSLVMEDRLGEKVLNPIIITKINEHKKLSKENPFWIVSNFLGNHANRIGLIRTNELFDFVSPKFVENSFTENVEFIPYELVKDVIYKMIEPLEELFQLLNKKKLSGIIHVEGPPPVWDEAYIQSHLLDAQKGLAMSRINTNGNEVIDFEINPFNFRKKLWLLQSEITREICERNNVKYLYPPEHVFNEFGGLSEAALRDSVHANTWYGKQILEQIYNETIQEAE